MNEIIVSAGALGSPQLLMLSGIGAANHLREHNISVVLDQPLVGQGMSDNPMNAVYVPSPSSVEVSLVSVVGITNFGSYIEATSVAARSGRDFTMITSKVHLINLDINQFLQTSAICLRPIYTFSRHCKFSFRKTYYIYRNFQNHMQLHLLNHINIMVWHDLANK